MTDRRPILLAASDPAWAATAETEMAAILEACSPHVTIVEHIGSTAVPGLLAKPVIDLMPVLGRLEDGAACTEPMQKLGYIYRGEYGIAGRYYFVRGEPRLFNVHMLVRGSDESRNHLLFRDHLRCHLSVAEEYARLKQELAVRFAHDVHAYADNKSDFCRRIIERAMNEQTVQRP